MIGKLVVADEDVHLAVVVEIEHQDAQSFTVRLQPHGLALVIQAAGLADIAERAVALILEQDTLVAMKFLGPARNVHAPPQKVLPVALGVVREIHHHIAADENIQVAGPMNVAEGATGAPAVHLDTRLFGYLAKAPSALAVGLVVVEMAMSITGNQEIGKAIVVVIADGDPLAEARMPDAGFVGDILEVAVSQVAVEPAG